MALRLPAFGIALQTGGILLGLTLLAFAPPTSGRMLLIPVTRQAAADVVPLALRAGGLLLGPGPLPHSYVVIGENARLASTTAGHGIVTIAAPPAGCGGTTA